MHGVSVSGLRLKRLSQAGELPSPKAADVPAIIGAFREPSRRALYGPLAESWCVFFAV
jgi:hypothetical protein